MKAKSSPKAAAKAAPTAQPTAAPSPATTAFLAEVDAALQQEKLLRLWQTHRWTLMALTLALLLAVAAQQGWQAWQRQQARSMAAQWYQLSQASGTQGPQLATFLQKSSGGYRALAAFKMAEQQTTAAEKAKAYAMVYQDTSQPSWLQSLARFNAALSLLGTNDAAAQTQLDLLTQPSQAAFATYPLALEQLALLAQRQNDTTTARAHTVKLLETKQLTPQLRQRALQRLGLLSTLAR